MTILAFSRSPRPHVGGAGAAVVPTASFAVSLVRTKLDAAGVVTDPAFAAQLRAAVAALVAAVPASPITA